MPYIPTDTVCNELTPNLCGGKMTPTMINVCKSAHFVGINDVTINQGEDFDPTTGVKAYDDDGTELSYSVDPTNIETCDVGEHILTYKTSGKRQLNEITLTCVNDILTLSPPCIEGEVTEQRVVTIKRSAPPTINGITPVEIETRINFDPMQGVSGVDDNDNPVAVSYSGKYMAVNSGDVISFEAESVSPIPYLLSEINPIQDLSHGDPTITNVCPISGWDRIVITVADSYDNPTDSNTYTINLSETTYGGILDVNNGLLTVTGVYRKLNTSTLSGSESWPSWLNSGVRDIIGPGYNSLIQGGLSSISNIVYANTDFANDIIFFSASQIGMTKSELKALAIDVDLYIPLMTPYPIHLTPTQVMSIGGETNVWSESGNVTAYYLSNIPQGTFQYLVEGEYSITYEATDQCGNTGAEVREISIEEVGTCFTFEFDKRLPISGEAYRLIVSLRNNSYITFEHSTLYHYGVKSVTDDAEYDVDTFGLSRQVTYISHVYFDATAEELQQGYKDITYTIEATTSGGQTIVGTATYRYTLI